MESLRDLAAPCLLILALLPACSAEPEAVAPPAEAAALRSAELERVKAELRAELPDVPRIGVDELAARLEQGERPLLVDVRAEREYAVSHLPLARRAESLEEAEALLAGEPREREVIVYCSIGYRSGHLADALRRAGWTNVRNLEGSIFEWANSGHTVWRGDEPVRVVHPYDAKWGRLLDRSLWSEPRVTYWPWLAGISLFFVLAERLRPARAGQRLLRAQWANDLGYLVFNGYVYAIVAGTWVAALALHVREVLSPWLPFAEDGTGLGALPGPVQFAIYLAISDLLQWGVHNLLHRVSWLWQFHKVHHSIHDMDWAGNFRFHWVELIVYGTLLYVPLALLGGDPGPLYAVSVFTTFWGHFNHANLDVGLGPLGWVLNSPRMHLWHHDASDEGGMGKNYGIVFSLWDRLFGTLYWPRDRVPARLGYPGDAELPRDLPRQMLFPLTRARRQGGPEGQEGAR